MGSGVSRLTTPCTQIVDIVIKKEFANLYRGVSDAQVIVRIHRIGKLAAPLEV